MPGQTTQSLHGSAPAAGTPCCESGRPVLTDPITGQTVCSCQYDAQLLNYQRLAASGLPINMYGTAAAYAGDQGFLPLGAAEQSAFYSPSAQYFTALFHFNGSGKLKCSRPRRVLTLNKARRLASESIANGELLGLVRPRGRRGVSSSCLRSARRPPRRGPIDCRVKQEERKLRAQSQTLVACAGSCR
ncbi:hypothetical protein HPB50_017658 [Hyalomma asiaticum]|uniref:Uncharacterized protein n=1 Tax=Hyalomma asiaticum TaxID=266040 RepID=A0ACB7TM65_HYAAI|nr:hypothetical protein HPB50_017658 [Hyalomma asiaticum]